MSDDVAAGCIPVFFSPESYALTPWYWGDEHERSADSLGRVLIDRDRFLNGSVTLKSALMSVPTAAIDAHQERLSRIAFGFQYSTDDQPGDAVDVMLRRLKSEADACVANVSAHEPGTR